MLPRHEQEDDDHHHQLERDQEQADGHARPQRDVDHVPRLAAEGGEGRACVGVGVDADAVPGHRVRSSHADDREEEDGEEGLGRFAPQRQEVVRHERRDDDEQAQQEYALLDEVGLAGLKDDVGDVEHRLVGGVFADLVEQIEADAQGAGDDAGAVEQDLPGAGAAELVVGAVAQVRNGQVRFAGADERRGQQQQDRGTENQFQGLHARLLPE